MAGRIKVISERIMSRGYEPAVARLMETVKTKVRAQPGLISVTTYNQVDDNHKYVVFSEWRSKQDYDRWVSSDEFKECTAKINELLDVPGLHTRVFKTPQEDIFLL
ncbi:Monooxygenase, partial [Globisporangium splendens]